MGINLCFVVVVVAAAVAVVAVGVGWCCWCCWCCCCCFFVLSDQPSYDVQNPGCLIIHVGIVQTHIILEIVTIHERRILFATKQYVLYVFWCLEKRLRCWCFLQIKWTFRKYTPIFRHIRIFILYVIKKLSNSFPLTSWPHVYPGNATVRCFHREQHHRHCATVQFGQGVMSCTNKHLSSGC